MIRKALLGVMLAGCANVALSQQFPVWERLLRHCSGKTDETPVPSMKMGLHMQMSLKGDPAPAVAARATEILAAANAVLSQCRPGSILYRRSAEGLKAIGVMYTAPVDASPHSIHTEEACRAAQGLWIPVVLNWMTHVYPNEPDQWGGMDTDPEAGAPDAGEVRAKVYGTTGTISADGRALSW